MSSFYRHSINHPGRAILLAAAVVLASAPGAARLALRTGGDALVPSRAPEVLEDRAVREAFGVDDTIVVMVRSRHPDGVFNTRTLRLLVELTSRLQETPGIGPARVSSLATEKGDRYRPGTLEFRRFTEPFPTTPEDLTRLRDDLEALELFTGTLVSRDGTAASILVGVPPGADRVELYDRIASTVAGMRSDEAEIDVIGAPVAEALLGTQVLEDLGVPLVLLGRSAGYDDVSSHDARGLHRLRRLVARTTGLLPLALLVMLTFPVVFSLVLALTFGTGETEPPKVRLLIEDLDQTFVSDFLVGAFGSGQAGKYFDTTEVGPEGQKLIERGKASVVAVGGSWDGDALVEAAQGAGLLVHEAHFDESVELAIEAGASDPERLRREAGWRTPLAEAGRRARRAGVRNLALVRLRPPPLFDFQAAQPAAEAYSGKIVVPQDGDEIGLTP